jgi:hypothetical protein
LLLSASLVAVAQNAPTGDERVWLRGGTLSGDPGPPGSPDPFGDLLSPAPMGLPQRFVVAPRLRSDSAAQTPISVHRSDDVMRRSRMRASAQGPGFRHQGTRTASARPLPLDAGLNQAPGTARALSFAPVERRRTRPLPFCFPSSASEQNGLNRCSTIVRSTGRFEELLAE